MRNPYVPVATTCLDNISRTDRWLEDAVRIGFTLRRVQLAKRSAMTLGGWLSVAIICALGAASPGPSLAVVTRHALIGRGQGLACALAHALGVGIYALLTVVGLAALFARYPMVYRGVAAVGAVYLLWLGAAALRAGGSASAGAPDTRPDRAGAMRDGFAIALLNPKIAIFFAALFSQFVSPGAGIRDTAILAATALGIDGAWYALVALALSGSGAVAWMQRRRQLLDRVTGVALIVLAAWALVQAFAAPV